MLFLNHKSSSFKTSSQKSFFLLQLMFFWIPLLELPVEPSTPIQMINDDFTSTLSSVDCISGKNKIQWSELKKNFLIRRYTVFDSSQMPAMAQPPAVQAPLLMVSQKQASMMNNQLSPPPIPMLPSLDVLSVSSKKLCSYCSHELGSGAAMIIENLGLFYHIDCFKCSVCQTPISDGNIHGTDVRVRNSRLHCHNCFSNEEGVKFSCVWLINLQFPPRRKPKMISQMWKRFISGHRTRRR